MDDLVKVLTDLSLFWWLFTIFFFVTDGIYEHLLKGMFKSPNLVLISIISYICGPPLPCGRKILSKNL